MCNKKYTDRKGRKRADSCTGADGKTATQNKNAESKMPSAFGGIRLLFCYDIAVGIDTYTVEIAVVVRQELYYNRVVGVQLYFRFNICKNII